MVEIGRPPGRGRMAGGTIASILSIMLIIVPMAGVAVCSRSPINIINMAICTRHLTVLAGQREGSQVVIESSRRPTRGGMAGGTGGAKPG